MPSQTPKETQERIVELRKAGKTYSQIAREVNVTEPVVTKYLTKAGMTGKRFAQAQAPAPTSAPQVVAPAPPVPPAVPASTPTTSGGDWLEEFQPPEVKEARKQHYKTDCCGGIFTLDEGEKLEDVKVCPHECGGVP